MFRMKNLGVTKGEGVFKIQPHSVCSRALVLFSCVSRGQKQSSVQREEEEAQCAPDHTCYIFLLYLWNIISFQVWL